MLNGKLKPHVGDPHEQQEELVKKNIKQGNFRVKTL